MTTMLLDDAMPTYDVTLAAHVVVHADPERTFAAARDLDFLRVRTPILLAAMWVRGLPAKVAHRAEEVPPTLLVTQGGLPGWVLLGERAGEEIAFGAVGVFWRPQIEWRDVERAAFAGFAEPGLGKIACNFSVRSYGEVSSLLSYECRTATTDDDSRRAFARYWRLIRPFVAHIMRATVDTIRDDAESGSGRSWQAGPHDRDR
jgi:hypothetical protein